MLWIRSFVAQQISISSCRKKPAVAFLASLPDGKGDGTIRIGLLDCPNNIAKKGVRKSTVLPSLQHEGAEIQAVSFFAAGKNFLRTKAISAAMGITPANPAIKAIVFADVSKFDEPTGIHCVAVNFFSYCHCFFP